MTIILFSFGVALAFSLLLTPLAGKAGARFGAMDMPGERKVHTHPTPRTGGLAIFMAFILALAVVYIWDTKNSRLLVPNQQGIFLMIGGVICFITGVVDDFRRLSAWKKLLLQILAATIAYAGGSNIANISFSDFSLSFGILNYGITVFWFLLFINAVNLVDGLDGLAGGLTFFTCFMMVILSALDNRYMIAVLFAALSGGILGFLRYNFNPASIFLGDGGSYFIGYAIAGMSILGSVKSQTGSAMLIPMIALGLPVFDTVLSSMRRFVLGKKIFGADKEHIHHRLLSLGLKTRRVVLMMYAISIVLCLLSLFLVDVRDEKAAFLLVLVGIGAVAFAKKLGYFNYINPQRLWSWIRDVTDETGFPRERRSFLNLQIDISKSKTLEGLWNNTTRAMDMLQFDCSMLYLHSLPGAEEMEKTCMVYPNGSDRRKTSINVASICLREKPPEFTWIRQSLASINLENACSRGLIRIELPLEGSEARQFGCLVLIKDTRLGNLSHYSLKRVEHLRRSVVGVLARIDGGKKLRRSGESAHHAKIISGLEDAGNQKLTPIDGQAVTGNSRRMLVVDDEVVILMALGEVLQKHGILVETATDAEEALKIFDEGMFSIVVLDVKLPGMSGLELCGRLKKIQPEVWIIAITGLPSQYESEICRKSGFDGYLVKPVDIEMLLMYAENVFNKTSRSQDKKI
jgi:UDP-GlcNAc:undecaprenyl-phosphate GlcNAc-1-phosphate transferase